MFFLTYALFLIQDLPNLDKSKLEILELRLQCSNSIETFQFVNVDSRTVGLQNKIIWKSPQEVFLANRRFEVKQKLKMQQVFKDLKKLSKTKFKRQNTKKAEFSLQLRLFSPSKSNSEIIFIECSFDEARREFAKNEILKDFFSKYVFSNGVAKSSSAFRNVIIEGTTMHGAMIKFWLKNASKKKK